MAVALFPRDANNLADLLTLDFFPFAEIAEVAQPIKPSWQFPAPLRAASKYHCADAWTKEIPSFSKLPKRASLRLSNGTWTCLTFPAPAVFMTKIL